MNLLKKISLLTVLLTINFTNGKSLQKPMINPPTGQATPAQKKPIQTPVIQKEKQSYKDLVNYIKKATNTWDNTNKILNEDFVDTLVKKARQAQLENFQLDALLQTARDAHAQFSNNSNNNIAILELLEKQRANAIR